MAAATASACCRRASATRTSWPSDRASASRRAGRALATGAVHRTTVPHATLTHSHARACTRPRAAVHPSCPAPPPTALDALSPSRRLSLSMLAGCVPVIIQPHVLMPLHDTLPYRRFSLSFNRSEIPTLHTRLAAVSDAAHERMRRAVVEHAAAFSWHDGGARGTAYEHVRYSLCLRAGLPCHHLRPLSSHVNVTAARAGALVPRARR
eukprot:7175396-Prymnesium_polylepis.2